MKIEPWLQGLRSAFPISSRQPWEHQILHSMFTIKLTCISRCLCSQDIYSCKVPGYGKSFCISWFVTLHSQLPRDNGALSLLVSFNIKGAQARLSAKITWYEFRLQSHDSSTSWFRINIRLNHIFKHFKVFIEHLLKTVN